MARKLSRRKLLIGAAATSLAYGTACIRGNRGTIPTADPESTVTPVLTSVAGYEDDRRWEGRSLVVATPGDEGSDYLGAQIEAIFEPFQRMTGASLRIVRTNLDDLRRQVNEADVELGVCDVPSEEVLPLANSGVIDEIDYGLIDDAGLYEPFLMPHGVAASLYATVLAYQQDSIDHSREPRGWEDYWDADRYPGFRGFQESPIGTLEFALLANGTPLDELYPLDVDEALEHLDEIVEQIILWWRQGAQPTQMIATGDLAMVSAWHDRILGLVEAGATVGLVWDGSQVQGDSWVVPNGTPEREVAMDFVNFATRPEVCAAFARLVPFGAVHSGAYELLPTTYRTSRPGAPGLVGRQFPIDLGWWFRNREATIERFQEWLDEEPETD